MENSKILPRIKTINWLIIIDLILIGAALLFFNYSDCDVEIQNHLFDFANKSWLIDRDEPVKKFIFYKFPKILLGCAIIFFLVASIIGFRKRKSPPNFFSKNRHQIFLIFLGLSLIPLIAGNVKKFTNVYCPCQLELYDGEKPYVKIFDSYPENFQQTKRAKCFPAGHSVTGFSLFILFFALRKKSWRIAGLLSALALGWILGFYQMAKGVHFFGDTLVSMLLCFLLAAVIARVYFLKISKKND